MDPDASLAHIRRVAAAVDGGLISDDHAAQLARELVDLFNGLDEWISRGGYLPRAWATQTTNKGT